MRIYKSFTFDASHRLPQLPDEHKCSHLHGHTFMAEVHLEGPVDPVLGWVMDFGDIKRLCDPVLDELDHKYLNEIEGLENPTSENLAVWLWGRIKPVIPMLCQIVVKESPTSGAVYCGE